MLTCHHTVFVLYPRVVRNAKAMLSVPYVAVSRREASVRASLIPYRPNMELRKHA
jgi:hypothetical protein